MNKTTLLIVFILCISAAHAITADVQISPQTATTQTALHCTVNATATGTLSANITWFVDDAAHTSDNETLQLVSGESNSTTEQGAVESDDTTKSQSWICQASITNTTNTTVINSTAVLIQNAAPIVTHPTNAQTVTEGNPVNILATADDPDGDDITYWVSNDLNSSQYDGEDLFEIGLNGMISFTPTYEQRGNHTMVISASDADLLGGKTVVFEVLFVNQEPRFDPSLSDDQTNNTQTWTYDITASDREEDPFNFSLVSSDLETVQLSRLNDSTAQLTLSTGQPRYEDAGLHEITVSVFDSENQSHNTTESFTLNITTTNDPPVLENITAPDSQQGQQFYLQVNATDINTNDTLQFSTESDCSLDNPWEINTTDSNASSGTAVINLTLTNDHVVCNRITISVFDFENSTAKDEDSQDIVLNITNTNDAPVVYENSTTEGTYSQKNMSSLQAAQDVAFTYQVNAQDPDSLTYEGEVLTYTDNTSIFDIDSQTGEISFTPQASHVGIHVINITVTDDQGESDSRNMSLNITANDAPVLSTQQQLECTQDITCNMSLEAFDDDNQENLTFTLELIETDVESEPTIDIQWQTYNTSLLEATFTNEQVGDYVYNLTVTDQWGAIDYQTLNITVENVNDLAFFDQDQNSIADTQFEMPEPVVEGHRTTFTVRVTDPDNLHTADIVGFSYNITGPDENLFSTSKVDNTAFFGSFIPDEDADGNYSVNFTVSDQYAQGESLVINFTVHNQSQSPNITHVAPIFNESDSNTIYELTETNSNYTSVSMVEPTPIIFNFTVTDPDSDASDLSIEWFKDSVSVQNNTADEDYSYTEPVGYHAQGEYTYMVIVTDELHSSTNFTWDVEIDNTNRPPTLKTDIPDRNITQSSTISNQMLAFLDPDDDLDDSGSIDGDENSSLTYTATINDTTVMDIDFDGEDLQITPKKNGVTTVVFTATDELSAEVTSNQVTYNVTAPEDESSGSSSSGQGGGSSSGGSGTSSNPVPIPVSQDPEPEAIQILVPEPLTIAYNQTIAAPLGVMNTGDREFRGVTLSAQTQAENVTFTFETSSFESIAAGEQKNTTLYINNFRTDGTYEIMVSAQAREPDVNDSAIIFINSLEQTSQGQAVQTRVTFARDLLSSNPECLELNELLSQATRAIETNQLEEAQRLVNAAVDGCRYLISESSRREETPGFIGMDWLFRSQYANQVLLAALAAVILIGGLLSAHYINAAKKD